jgi:Putative prokaryotic signal transducing protein
MVTIFSANSTAEAQQIKNLLAQQGIAASVDGQYLQGGFGELPLIASIQVQVHPDDASAALQIVTDYDAGMISPDDEN